MTLDEKLDLFYKAAIEDATTQGREMIESYQEEVIKKNEEQKELIRQRAQAMLRTEIENITRAKNKTLSKTSKEIKRQILEEVNSYKEILFSDVKKKLLQFMQTPEYDELLKKQILEAKKYAEEEELIVYINSSDQKKKEELERETKVSLTISDQDFMGGTRAVMRGRNLLIDNSFLTRLSEAKESYTM